MGVADRYRKGGRTRIWRCNKGISGIFFVLFSFLAPWGASTAQEAIVKANTGVRDCRVTRTLMGGHKFFFFFFGV